ncbi:translation initiation factor IF-1 [Candidatus Tremblaya phenacola]|uniref:translation initiation factor IF-1 n=1 Tax=Candidatus Tremblayella phenacoccinincola TaxID=1010676 RepID=UPI0010F33D4E|nr:translation initiation factor IF-1 [Candidatus Tremblaya phenacola]KAH0998246.1 Translation initiation factor 1 [Candidatus Tremblaya phenacola]
MPKTKHVQMHGEVIENLSNTNFRVRLENSHVVLAYVSGKMRIHFIKILPGDMVTVEVSPYDPLRARIIFRTKPNHESVSIS